jgi:dolichol kinase
LTSIPTRPAFRAMEYARGMVHTALGLVLVLILNLFPWLFALILLIIGTSAVLVIEYWRLKNPSLNQWLHLRLAVFMRDEEDNGLTGASYYLIGSLITAFVFPVNITSLAILYLAFGDPSAATMGRWRGHRRPWNKHIEGNLAFLFVSIAIGILAMRILETPNIFVVVVGAFFAALMHTLPLPQRINDNVTIPIGSALAMGIAYFILPY